MTKHEVLRVLQARKIVTTAHLETELRVTGSAARAALHRLLRQQLVRHFGDKWVLTDRGAERLAYFEQDGCSSEECPWCQDGTA
jgi:hypothetical protein